MGHRDALPLLTEIPFQAALEAVPDMLRMSKADGTTCYLTEALASMSGLPAQEQIGRTPSELVPDIWPRGSRPDRTQPLS